MTSRPIILWFRNDLRLKDHAALTAAVATGAPVIPVYVLDDVTPGRWTMGGASRWWLHHSLAALSEDLEARGSYLMLAGGDALKVITDLARQTGASHVYCSRAYEPFASALERGLKDELEQQDCALKRYAGALLAEPEAVLTKGGGPYKVYTPFWRALSAQLKPHAPKPAPKAIASPRRLKGMRLEDFALLPAKPDWAGGLREAWTPGEAGASERLTRFLGAAMAAYAEDRNRPDLPGTSRLSPHLHFGEISPNACVWHARTAAARRPGTDAGCETFLKELAWRDFSHHLLAYVPSLPEKPFRPGWDVFPWKKDASLLAAWRRGRTGYPIVDAGMRELWQTGVMHNRVRMIVASFLVKDLLIPWQEGEAWFWDTLVDADLANNSASWQWVAGCGADAAPYFRIFNPVSQGEKFDPDGAYMRRFVPELAQLPNAHLHAPFEAPKEVLAAARITLGRDYPLPVVDHKRARVQALAAYERVKAGTGASA